MLKKNEVIKIYNHCFKSKVLIFFYLLIIMKKLIIRNYDSSYDELESLYIQCIKAIMNHGVSFFFFFFFFFLFFFFFFLFF